MANVTENALIILRVMEEMGITSAKRAQEVVDILQESNLTEDEFQEARIFLGGIDCIKTLGPEEPITWLTPEGIVYIKIEMAERYPINLDAERILRYVVEAAPEMGLGIPVSEIMDALKMDEEKFNKAFNQLEVFGLAKWNASYVDPTVDGRQAIYRNFRDPAVMSKSIEASTYFEGPVNTGGGDIVGRDKIVTLDPRFLEELFQRVDAGSYSEQDKEDIKDEIREVGQEAQKGEAVNETFLSRHLRNILRMAPDIFDVVVASLANPAAGLGMAVKKIAEKAKAEADKAK
jgi:hypothetical protein